MANEKWNDIDMAKYYLTNVLESIFPDVFENQAARRKLEIIYAERIKIDAVLSQKMYGTEPNVWRAGLVLLEAIATEGTRFRYGYEDEINEWLDDNL